MMVIIARIIAKTNPDSIDLLAVLFVQRLRPFHEDELAIGDEDARAVVRLRELRTCRAVHLERARRLGVPHDPEMVAPGWEGRCEGRLVD